LWIVGKWVSSSEPWEFQGVYDDIDLAISNCISNNYFVGPAKLNDTQEDAHTEWTGCFYPNLEGKKSADNNRITMDEFNKAMRDPAPLSPPDLFSKKNNKQSWLDRLIFGKDE
tara:strand:- start:372 stop:710 length:339 start_codon:yes stop_codon:yes gene_type:complete